MAGLAAGTDMPDEDVTIGELSRRMVRIEEAVTKGFEKLTERLDRDYVHIAVYAADSNALQERITRLEASAATADQRAWQVRFAFYAGLLSVPASVIAGVLARLL